MRSILLGLVLLSTSLVARGGDPAPSASATAGGETASFPATYEPMQGGSAFGVYVAHAATADAPELVRAMDALRARGVSGGVGELSCDTGAADALGLSGSEIAVSVDFRTREDAERFAASWGPPIAGIAEFVAHCRD